MFINNDLYLYPSIVNKYPLFKMGFTLPACGNLSFTRKSILSGKSTLNNRLKLYKDLEIGPDRVYSPHQIHSNKVISVTTDHLGHGSQNLKNTEDGDASITNLKNTLLISTWADCIPVILFDPVSYWIANIHSGWKGTHQNIIGNTINQLKKYEVKIQNLYAVIGPGIQSCCYEVGDEFYQQFHNTNLTPFFTIRDNRYFFHLSDAVYFQLEEAKLLKENIIYYNRCTCCSNNPGFFSCRKDSDQFEGQAAFVMVKK